MDLPGTLFVSANVEKLPVPEQGRLLIMQGVYQHGMWKTNSPTSEMTVRSDFPENAHY